MMKWIQRILWAIVFLYLLGMVIIAFIPQELEPGDAPRDERKAVEQRILEIKGSIPNVRINKAQARENHVVAVFAGWTGDNPPARKDKDAWNEEADKVAAIIARDYLEEPWQVNVSVWFRSKLFGVIPWGFSLPLGMAGREAGSLEGGPGPHYKNYPGFLQKQNE